MAANRPPVDTQDMYFTPPEKIAKALQGRVLDPEKMKQCPEYYNETSTRSSQDIFTLPYTEYYEYDDIHEEYVLPPKNHPKSSHSPSDVNLRPATKRDVRDLYDEDHYALPDISGCVTKGAGVLKMDPGEKQPPISSKATENKCWANKWRISGVIFLILVAGGIGGIVLTVFTGIISFFLHLKPLTYKKNCFKFTIVLTCYSEQVSGCESGKHECDGGKCIPSQYVCNDINDCTDLTDEQGCGCCLLYTSDAADE